jgi:16S rRNA (cytosine967-C5)-methyltransferase
VLVDAPCSGSGTWRRAPHLKWTTTAELVTARAQLQRQLLDRFAGCVRPGGLLVYATCSLSDHENAAVVSDFLAAHRGFAAEAPARTFGFEPTMSGMTILPARHDTDGFFVAALRRR